MSEDLAATYARAYGVRAKPLRYFVKGNSMGCWLADLEPEADEPVISKQYPSAFFGASLAST